MVQVITGETATKDCMVNLTMRTKALVKDEDSLAIQDDIQEVIRTKGRNIFFSNDGLNGTLVVVGLIQYKSVSVNQINDMMEAVADVLNDYGYDARQKRVQAGHPEDVALIQ